MRTVFRALLVSAVTATLLIVGISAASASTAAPATAATAVTAVTPSMIPIPPGGGGSGLHCRSHAAESRAVRGKVVVPWSYCYDPTTNNHRAWHDYCTKSPDSYGRADFRGPCARHDMCLQSTRSHSRCDGPLLSNMKTNCRYAYGRWNPARYTCESVAYGYYVVIKARTYI